MVYAAQRNTRANGYWLAGSRPQQPVDLIEDRSTDGSSNQLLRILLTETTGSAGTETSASSGPAPHVRPLLGGCDKDHFPVPENTLQAL